MKKCTTSQEIWHHYLQGNDQAFESLYNAFVGRLFSYGCNFTTDEALVKDAIQEVFLKLYQRDKASIDNKKLPICGSTQSYQKKYNQL